MKKRWLTTAALIAVVPVLIFAEIQQAAKNDMVREKPFIDAKTLLAVKTGQSVDVQKREGAWYFVKVGKTTGWVPMLSVRRQQTTAAPGKATTTTSTGRSANNAIINTTGVRGLNEDTLKTAIFSEEAVAAAEKNRVSLPEEAAAFAAAGGIVAQTVPPLPASNGGKK